MRRQGRQAGRQAVSDVLKSPLFVALLLTVALADMAARPVLAQPADPPQAWPASPASVSVCFTPPVGCAERIVEAFASARREVLVQAYESPAHPSCTRSSRRIDEVSMSAPFSTR